MAFARAPEALPTPSKRSADFVQRVTNDPDSLVELMARVRQAGSDKAHSPNLHVDRA